MIVFRPLFTLLPMAFSAGLVLAPDTGAHAATMATHPTFSCPSAAPAALCGAFEAQLRKADPALRVRLDALRVTPVGLSARLVWSRGDGAPETGPILDMVMSDRPLDASFFQDFAAELLRVSNLPR
ncbi:hypothetical protein [Mesobacterium pallidum]|uniref:hypothetical protein n=1 Tax=Mesobacterium pallidum TaxID=2872037 RepID=UPI001EE2A121|nr:hypothetical protein [Mesobacterium pallidum]